MDNDISIYINDLKHLKLEKDFDLKDLKLEKDFDLCVEIVKKNTSALGHFSPEVREQLEFNWFARGEWELMKDNDDNMDDEKG